MKNPKIIILFLSILFVTNLSYSNVPSKPPCKTWKQWYHDHQQRAESIRELKKEYKIYKKNCLLANKPKQ